MISLVMGAPRERTDQELMLEAQYVNALLADQRFSRLVMDTADRIVFDWSHAPSTEKREAEWYKLQGLQSLLKQMQSTVEHGTPL